MRFRTSLVAVAAVLTLAAAPLAGATENEADISVSLTGPSALELGQHGTFVAKIVNTGRLTARGLTLTDALPSGLHYVNAWSSTGVCYGGIGAITCNLDAVHPGQEITVTIVAEAAAIGPAEHVVRISTTTIDRNLFNQSSAMVVTVRDKAAATPQPAPAAQPAAPAAAPVAAPPAAQPSAAKPKAKKPPAKKTSPKKKR